MLNTVTFRRKLKIILTKQFNYCKVNNRKVNNRKEVDYICMKIFSQAIVSNSEMAKNYKGCREKAEKLGKVYILKNNQPDAVMLSILEYEKYSAFIEYMDNFDDKEIAEFIEALKRVANRESADPIENDII